MRYSHFWQSRKPLPSQTSTLASRTPADCAEHEQAPGGGVYVHPAHLARVASDTSPLRQSVIPSQMKMSRGAMPMSNSMLPTQQDQHLLMLMRAVSRAHPDACSIDLDGDRGSLTSGLLPASKWHHD